MMLSQYNSEVASSEVYAWSIGVWLWQVLIITLPLGLNVVFKDRKWVIAQVHQRSRSGSPLMSDLVAQTVKPRNPVKTC